MKRIIALMTVATMMIAIVGCTKSKDNTANQTTDRDDYSYSVDYTEESNTEDFDTIEEEETTELITEETTEVITSTEEETTTEEVAKTDAPTEDTTEATRDENEISPELKEFLDSYEAFIDEYCEFMQKYSNASAMDMLGMLADYTEYVTKLTDMEKKMNAYDSSSMTTAEALYYSEVMLRCSQKLLTAVQ